MAGPLLRVADPDDVELLEAIGHHLGEGGLLAYPTETVYGLGASVDESGVRSVSALKGRSEGNPFLVLVPGATGLGLEWTPAASNLAEALWPGPITLVLSDPDRRFPGGVRNERGGVAVRVSPHPFVIALMEVWQRPLVSTSANPSGGDVVRSASEVSDWVLGRDGVDRLWIVDGGELPASEPSTVVDCTSPVPLILREGAVSASVLRDLVPVVHPLDSHG